MLLTKKVHQCTIFRLLGPLMMKVHPILHVVFETTMSVFLLNFASLFNAMGDNSSVLFYVKLYLIFTKGDRHSAKFQTSDCSGEISPNLYFDRLLFWKRIKFHLKKVWRSYVSWNQRVIVCTSLPLRREVEPPTNFSKKGGFTGPQLLEGGCWERGGWLFSRVGLQFYIKKQIEIWNI